MYLAKPLHLPLNTISKVSVSHEIVLNLVIQSFPLKCVLSYKLFPKLPQPPPAQIRQGAAPRRQIHLPRLAVPSELLRRHVQLQLLGTQAELHLALGGNNGGCYMMSI